MRRGVLVAVLLLGVILGGCVGETIGGDGKENVRLLLPFRPDVQFAPFYVAIEKGYFDEVGIEVTIQHLAENEAVALVGAGEASFGVVSGEQVLLARAQGIPVTYVMAWWQDYPVAVAVPEDSPIQTLEDLEDKKVGIPGLFGASYIGFRALLNAAGIQEEDLELDSIGYNQVEAMLAGQEDAVVIYANNEPLQMKAQGFPVRLLRVADYVHLTSNGLITNEAMIDGKPDLVENFVEATLRGIQDVMEDPEEGFEISKKFVDGLDQADQTLMLSVLEESVRFWEAERLGVSEEEAWRNMHDLLLEMGLLPEPTDIEQAFSNEFVP